MEKAPNLRTIFVSYHGFKPDGTGPFVKFTDRYVHNSERVKTKIVYMDNHVDEYLNDFAQRKLTESGFNVVSRSTTKDEFLFHCDNWGDDFKEVTDIK